MINVIISDQYQDFESEPLLIAAAEVVLKQEGAGSDVELSVVIGDDDRLQELNKQFLGIDSPTDVLSFPADQNDPDSGLHYIGDIIISYPRAVEQAATAKETLNDELQLLVIHGALHILGYDHRDPTEKKAMWNAQRTALDTLGCAIQNLPE